MWPESSIDTLKCQSTYSMQQVLKLNSLEGSILHHTMCTKHKSVMDFSRIYYQKKFISGFSIIQPFNPSRISVKQWTIWLSNLLTMWLFSCRFSISIHYENLQLTYFTQVKSLLGLLFIIIYYLNFPFMHHFFHPLSPFLTIFP